MTVWIRSRVQMPNYVKESIRSLVKSICDKDVDVSIALHKESKNRSAKKILLDAGKRTPQRYEKRTD